VACYFYIKSTTKYHGYLQIIEHKIKHTTLPLSSTWRTSLCDVRNKRGADNGSDHHLVIAKIKLKVVATFKPLLTRSRKFNINTLKDKDSKQELPNISLKIK
jgi:hypothetical protein